MKRLQLWSLLLLAVVATVSPPTFAQHQDEGRGKQPVVPVDTQLTLDAATPVQKPAIRAVCVLQDQRDSSDLESVDYVGKCFCRSGIRISHEHP